MASPFDVSLPAVGAKPWNLNPALTEIRTRIGSTDDIIATGRLSETGVSSAAISAGLSRFVEQGAIVHSIEDFGASGTNTDDTQAWIDAVASMPNIPNNGKGILFIPPGQTNVNPAAWAQISPVGKSIHFMGAGKNISEVRPTSGATGDFMQINGLHSIVSDITVNGRVTVMPGLGDAIVLNAPYARFRDIRIQDVTGNGLSVGKTGSAIGSHFYGIQVRNARGYGVRIYGDFTSTDCEWVGGDIGQSGKSGIRIDAAAQNMELMHVWGSGMWDATDNHGFYILGRRQILIGCQSETNMGHGMFIDGTADGQHVTAEPFVAFGNGLNGVRLNSTSRNRITGDVERNGVLNAGNNQTTYAGVVLANATDNTVDVTAWDADTTISAITPPSGAPISYPGRTTAAKTQTYGTAETGTANRNDIRGMQRGEDHRSTLGQLLTGGQTQSTAFVGQNTGAAVPSTPAASPLTIPPAANVVEITGSTVVNNVTAGKYGRRVTLVFTGATPGGISSGATGIRLTGGAFNPTTGGSITLVVGPGGTWYESSRAV